MTNPNDNLEQEAGAVVPCLRLSADWCDGFLIVEDDPCGRQDGIECIGLDLAQPGDKLIVSRLTMTREELDQLPEFDG